MKKKLIIIGAAACALALAAVLKLRGRGAR